MTSRTTPSPAGPTSGGAVDQGPQRRARLLEPARGDRQTFSKGWLHTGDVARLDEDNFIYIVDRAKDMIIRGGENVYSVAGRGRPLRAPRRGRLRGHRRARSHARRGGRGGGRAPPGAKVTADELGLHVKARLAGFMVPTHIWFRSEPLPRNPQGKVLKRDLRDELVPPTA